LDRHAGTGGMPILIRLPLCDDAEPRGPAKQRLMPAV
jgi:hypothetical protein